MVTGKYSIIAYFHAPFGMITTNGINNLFDLVMEMREQETEGVLYRKPAYFHIFRNGKFVCRRNAE